MISDEMLKKYLVYKEQPEEDLLRNFLNNTDYIAAKLAEAAYTNEPLKDDYTEVLQARKYARERLDVIMQGKAEAVDSGMTD